MLSETIKVTGFVGCVSVSLYKDPDSEGQDAPYCREKKKCAKLSFIFVLFLILIVLAYLEKTLKCEKQKCFEDVLINFLKLRWNYWKP
jgi:hypothetical protein